MTEYLSDKEQIEQIKEWWRENGIFIFAGVALGLVGIFGWKGYNSHLDKQAMTASNHYDDLSRALGSKNQENIEKNLKIITSEYSGTPYAAQANLLAARDAVQNNDLAKAASLLSAAVSASKDRELTTLATFRLAKVKFAQAEYDEVLKQLGNVKSKDYQGLVEELRGDVFAAQGKKEEARKAYESARTAMEETRVGDVNLLQMKLSDLGS